MKKCRPLCRSCNDKQETTYKRKCEDIEFIPTKTKNQKIQAKYRHEKRQYNTELKCKRKKCNDCNIEVNETNAKLFHWAHIDAFEKSFTISNIVGDTTCFQTAKKRIDAEVLKCELKCAACHKKETDKRRDMLVYEITKPFISLA